MKKQTSKILTYMRRNALYLILGACILAVGLSITLMLVKQTNELSNSLNDRPTITDPIDPNEPETPVGPSEPEQPEQPETPEQPVAKPITFIVPVENSIGVGEYVETMAWNSTLGRYTAHKAIDFYAQEGTGVMAVYDGVVESVVNSLLTGITITIDHGNGLKTVYNSLADGDLVVEGQAVKQGEKIGEVSVTNRQEHLEGPHLHFEVYENGEKIDPIKYLQLDEK